MEFSYLGKHCYKCSQQDYLPFLCKDCNHYYCLEHRFHGCLDKTDTIIVKRKKRKKIKKKSNSGLKCHDKNCNENYFDTYKCKYCNKHYCIHHSHHKCSKRHK